MSGLINVYFLGLSAGGFDSLWGSLMRSGAAQALGAIKTTGLLPSGDKLITTYTGVSWIDKWVLSPVIFYDSLMYTRNPVHRALLVSVFSSMQATSFAMLLNDVEKGGPTWQSLVEHAAWGVFNQSYGAGFVYPLYCLSRISRSAITRRLSSRCNQDAAQAEALVYTSIFFALIPTWLLYPAFVYCSSETRQLLIASYRASPLILGLCQPAIACGLRKLRKTTGRSLLPGRPEALTRLSLYIAAGSSALGHAYAVLTAIFSPDTALANVFFPWAAITQNDLRQSSSVLQRGCHLFLQYDLVVITAALVPYVTMMFSFADQRRAKNENNERSPGWLHRLGTLTGMQRLFAWTGLAILASPGLVFPLALATGY